MATLFSFLYSFNSSIPRISPTAFVLSPLSVIIFKWVSPVLQDSHLNEGEIEATAKLSFAAATICLTDQYIQFDSELRFFSRNLYFTSLLLKNNWKRNLFLLDGALLLLYGVKMWLHSDADSAPWEDRQESKKAAFPSAFSKSIQTRHQLKTPKPLSQWEYCHLLLSEGTKAHTYSKNIPIRQTNISNLSTPCVSSD